MKTRIRCRSKLLLAGRSQQCLLDTTHDEWHAWWSKDGRVEVKWKRGSGGSLWRFPLTDRAEGGG